MIDNKSLITKADLQLSELQANGGYLPEAHAAKFVKTMIKEGILLNELNVMTMRAPKQVIDKARFNSRVLRAGNPGEALALAERSKPDLGKVELSAELWKAEVRLEEETLEDNIERGDFVDSIMQMMAAAIARDVDEYLILGDTASADIDLAQMDGMLKQATSNVVAAGGVQLNKGIGKAMLQALPSEFARDRAAMKYYTGVNAELDYRDQISDRATQMGDERYDNGVRGGTVRMHGIPVIPVPSWPEDQGNNNDQTSVILANPANCAVGIWRQIKMRSATDISAGVLIIVASLRMDFTYIEESAVVKATGVAVGG